MVEVKDGSGIQSYSCPKCYLCGNEGKLLYKSLKDSLFGAPGEWNLKKCTNPECALVWLDPVPYPEEINKAYNSYYTHEYPIQNSQGRRIAAKCSSYIKFFLAHISGFRPKERALENMYLDNITPGKLLDIGCGSGNFLAKMREQGWNVEGVDFDPKAIKVAKEKHKLNVHQGTIQSINYPSDSFDAITMSHVIEHVHDPISLIEECYRLLKQDGYLVMVTPNIESWGHLNFTSHWRGLEPPRHLFLFSCNTLGKCATAGGFKNVNSFTTAAYSLGIFIESINATTKEKTSNSGKIYIINLLKSMYFQYKEFALLLNKNNSNAGEILVVIAQKNI